MFYLTQVIFVSVYLICKAENELLRIPESDLSTRCKLSENLGDYCVKLQNFVSAITYYKKTLEVCCVFILNNLKIDIFLNCQKK